MGEVLRGVRLRDWLLAGALSAVAAVLAVDNITQTDASAARAIASGSMYHAMSTHTWWILAWFLAASVPVLWWRRGVLSVTVWSIAVFAAGDIALGWVGRCGFGLPLALVLGFLGAVQYDRRKAWLSFGLTVVLMAVVLIVDAITGLGLMLVIVPIGAVIFFVGRAVRHRAALGAELKVRNEQLRELRDQRAALEVAGDRARLSRQLDGLLQVRLEQLSDAAESADGLGTDEARALLVSIEDGSRKTLDDMREIVGLLRGGDVSLAPAPTVAHLDALLARHSNSDARLAVTGDPRSLPATVELSAYRIVEHLVTALAHEPASPVDVAIRFDDRALEIRVTGPVDKGADVKAAVARARERAKLLGGSVDLKVSRGRANMVAQLPVLG